MLDAGAFDGGIVPKLRAAALAAAQRHRRRRSAARRWSHDAGVAARSKLLPTYARLDVTFTDGDGAWLVDADGKRYLDLFAGIAVVGLGHRHPAPLAAAHAQLDRLWHVSNLYWTEPMQELSRRSSPTRFGGAQAFFCNSGAESVEAALKWARKVTGRSRGRRARRLVPRPHARRALGDGPAGEARRRSSRSSPAPLRDARDARRRTSAPTRRRSCSSPCRARAACIRSRAETLAEARALADATARC